jgi:hypothetical protein
MQTKNRKRKLLAAAVSATTLGRNAVRCGESGAPQAGHPKFSLPIFTLPDSPHREHPIHVAICIQGSDSVAGGELRTRSSKITLQARLRCQYANRTKVATSAVGRESGVMQALIRGCHAQIVTVAAKSAAPMYVTL